MREAGRFTSENTSNTILNIRQVAHEKIVNQEEIVSLVKTGLLSLRVASLQKEIADIVERTEKSKKLIAELPLEIERFNASWGKPFRI